MLNSGLYIVAMYKSDAIDLYGSVKALAYALNITQWAVYQWQDVVPELRARQICELNPNVNFDAKLYR